MVAGDGTWEYWADKIEELDAGSFNVTEKEADFLSDLLERCPRFLSSRQIKWLEDMCTKYGVS